MTRRRSEFRKWGAHPGELQASLRVSLLSSGSRGEARGAWGLRERPAGTLISKVAAVEKKRQEDEAEKLEAEKKRQEEEKKAAAAAEARAKRALNAAEKRRASEGKAAELRNCLCRVFTDILLHDAALRRHLCQLAVCKSIVSSIKQTEFFAIK